MKIICKRIDLAKALHKISKVVTSQKNQPILTNILFIASDLLVIKSRSITSYLKLQIKSDIKEQGQCCTLASKVIDAIDSFTCEYITLETDKELLVIKGNNVTLKLETVNPEYYPKDNTYNQPTLIGGLKLKSKELNEAIQKCIPFVNDTGITAGINFDLKDTTLSVCGCSSIAAGFVSIGNIENVNKTNVNFTLTVKDAINISTILEEEDITIEIFKTYVKIAVKDDFFITNVISGRYPNFNTLLNSKFEYKLYIDKIKTEEVFKLIDIVAITNIATIEYGPDSYNIIYKEQVNSIINTPKLILEDKILFGIDYSYLRKIFKVTSSEDLTLNFKDNRNPVIIKDGDSVFFISLASPQKI